MALTLDRPAIVRGMATFVGIAIPFGILTVVLDGSLNSTAQDLVPLAALVSLVVAPLAGGYVAGSTQRSPFLHGAAAVALPGIAYLIVWIGDNLVRGRLRTVAVTSILLYLVIVTALGMLGAFVGFRRRNRVT